jgi:hypothetical protein
MSARSRWAIASATCAKKLYPQHQKMVTLAEAPITLIPARACTPHPCPITRILVNQTENHAATGYHTHGLEQMKLRMRRMKLHMRRMKLHMQGMKLHMRGMKLQMQGMKLQMQGMKLQMQGMKLQMRRMKLPMQGMKLRR